MVVSRGKILESKTITPVFDDSYQSVYVHRFSVNPHFDYAPEAKITVYCVHDGCIVSSSFVARLDEDFKNFIDIDISQDLVKPGDAVDIKIKSNPNSCIGLLGVDESALILRSGNDLDRGKIWDELKKINGFPVICNINAYMQLNSI